MKVIKSNSLRHFIAAMFLFIAAMPLCAVNHENTSPKHEMRGAWLATVYGIDWPRVTGTSAAIAEAQKRELVQILDRLQSSGINAVLFQVRSMSDAMYRSSYEPWSSYLTGTRGEAPVEWWDPLEFAVAEAHARGMELHAWVNPFRLSNGEAPEPQRSAHGNHMFDPQGKGWVISHVTYTKGNARKGKRGRREKSVPAKRRVISILDPGNSKARKHIVNVCKEIVTKYDVDGLIFDDYFYPDRLPLGDGYDYDEWRRQCGSERGGKNMTQADWRRENVNKTIEEVAEMIADERPWVRFGVSPAGVGGGNGKATAPYGLEPPSAGSDWMYDRIFCNPVAWLARGIVDYVSPQIYWASTHETNPYVPIAQWWHDLASHFGRHCYPSQKVLALPAGRKAWKEQELQVLANRKHDTSTVAAGSIFYSTAHITGKKAEGLGEHLSRGCYRYPALMPATSWKHASNPGDVKKLKRKGNVLTWNDKKNMRYVVYAVPQDVSYIDALASSGVNFMAEYIIAVTYDNKLILPDNLTSGYWYAVSHYDRYGNEWEATILN